MRELCLLFLEQSCEWRSEEMLKANGAKDHTCRNRTLDSIDQIPTLLEILRVIEAVLPASQNWRVLARPGRL